MNKKEFLEILKQSLNKEVKPEVIDQNIQFYDQYINAQTETEMIRILSELGDPRLIAKTIIEAERASELRTKNTGYHNDYNRYDTKEDATSGNQSGFNRKNEMFSSNFTWYQKLMFAIIVFVIIVVILLIGRVVIRLLFAFAIPLLLVLIVWNLFQKR